MSERAKKINPTNAIHMAVWLSAVVVPLFVFPFYTRLSNEELWLFLPIKLIGDALTAVFFYVNYYRFVPDWMVRKRFGRFALIVAVIFLLLLAIDIVYVQLLVKPLLKQSIFAGLDARRMLLKGPTPLPKVLGIVFYFALALVISSALAIQRYQQAQQERQQFMELAKVTAELEVLKLQISPHFLFNTLNNIRSLVRKKSDNAEEVIIKLSSLLRYMLYQSKNDTVPLAKEINHLNDYMALQKLRLSRPEDVSFSVLGTIDGVVIEPLLFIPFVENAFKYGVHAGRSSAIAFQLNVLPDTLYFESRNYVSDHLPDSDDETGIGLDNVRKRLQLYYPDRHTLTIDEINGEFIVKMILTLHP